MKNFTFKHILCNLILLTTCALATSTYAKDSASAQPAVTIDNAWARPTNKGQNISAAYMTLTSKQDSALIKAESSVTKDVEIHSMSMEKGVMKMRMLDSLLLSAGKPSELKPGGFHLMLFDLKKPLTLGEQIIFKLTFKNKDGAEFTQQVTATVKAESEDHSAHEHSHEHHH